MRAPAALLSLALLAACGGASPAVPRASPHPLRVFSANQCTDQIVLALLPPSRIASVSWLSRDPHGSLMAAAARRVPVNHGRVEEVIAQRPDLVVAGSFTTPALRGLLKRLGYPLLEVDEAGSVADIRRVVRQIAAAVDERPRGEALIAQMDRGLAALPAAPRPVPVVAWDGSGFATGRGSLFDTLLAAAGARNMIAGDAARYQRPDVERLLQADPALLVEGAADPRFAPLGDSALRHPLVRRLWRGRTVSLPQGYYVCGSPAIADAAIRLRAALRDAADRVGSAPPLVRTAS